MTMSDAKQTNTKSPANIAFDEGKFDDEDDE